MIGVDAYRCVPLSSFTEVSVVLARPDIVTAIRPLLTHFTFSGAEHIGVPQCAVAARERLQRDTRGLVATAWSHGGTVGAHEAHADAAKDDVGRRTSRV